MKKSLVALATLAATCVFAQTTDGKPGVQINGLFNAGYQANSYKGVSFKGIDQNGSGTSQLNFRMLEDLGGGFSAYGRLESDFSFMNNAANIGILPAFSATNSTAGTAVTQRTTSGGTGTFANSEVVAGLRSPMGDFAFGQMHNAGLLNVQLVASPLSGTSFGGGYGSILGADPTLTATRWANSFRYITPNFSGFTAQYIQAFKQNQASVPVSATTGVAATTTSLGMGLNNQLGAKELSLKYANGPLVATVTNSRTSIDSFCAAPSSTSTNTNSTGANPCYVNNGALATGAVISTAQSNKQNSVAASYDLPNGFKVSGATQRTTLGNIGTTVVGDQSSRSATLFTVQYNSGVHTVFATHGSVKENAALAATAVKGKSSTLTGFGYNYALSKNTSLVARYETLDDQANVLGLTGTTAYASLQGTTSTDMKRVRSQFGMHMNF